MKTLGIVFVMLITLCGCGSSEPIPTDVFCEEYADYACSIESMCYDVAVCDVIGMINRCNARYACLSEIDFEVACLNSLIVYAGNCSYWEAVEADCQFDACDGGKK